MEYEYVKIVKIDYTPKEYQDDWNKLPLVTHIFGVTETGEGVHLKIFECEPRFWTKQNPDDLDIPDDMRKHITRVEYDDCVTYSNNPEPLYTVYIDYPFLVSHSMWRAIGLRGYFNWHGQADIPYRDTVRYFYGWKDVLKIPKGKRRLHIDEVEPVDGINIQTNDYMLDIEAFNDDGSFADGKYPTGTIYCWSLKNLNTGDIHHATILDIDKEKILESLHDKTFLYNNCTINEKKYKKDYIEPITDRIHLYKFTTGTTEQREIMLLKGLKKLIEKLGVNIIEGFNVDDFDVSYIRNRISKMNRKIAKRYDHDKEFYGKIDFNKLLTFDLMEGYRSYRHKTTLGVEDKRIGLDWLGKEIINYGKIKRPSMTEMRDKSPNHMSIYNIWDVELPARIEKELGVLDYYKDYCADHGCSINHYASMVFLAESAVMHEVKCKEIFPSRRYVERVSMEKIGAAIDEASKGVHRNMIEVDLSGQYPGAIMTGNLDIKTKIRHEIPGVPFVRFPSGRMYRLDRQGTIPGMMHELRRKRNVIRKIMKDNPRDSQEYKKAKKDQEIIKHSMASWSGGFGTVDGKTDFVARFADNGIYNDITEISRLLKGWNKKRIEEHEYPYTFEKITSDNFIGKTYKVKLTVRYGDTDSCKCTINDSDKIEKFIGREFTEKDLRSIGEHYAEMLNDSYGEFSKQYLGVEEHYFSVKAEDPIKAYFQWGRKKLYVELDFDGVRHDKGVGTVRSDKGVIMKEVMDYTLDRIIRSELDKLPEYFFGIEQDILSGKYNIELGTPQRVKTETNMWYKNMMLSNKLFKDKRYRFKIGSKPTFFYLSKLEGHVLPKNRVVAFKTGDNPVDMGAVIDYKKHLTVIRNGLKSILAGLGTTWGKIRDGLKTGNLEEFF
jgi:DNA polymerase elongation subunit (family B)